MTTQYAPHSSLILFIKMLLSTVPFDRAWNINKKLPQILLTINSTKEQVQVISFDKLPISNIYWPIVWIHRAESVSFQGEIAINISEPERQGL